MFTVSPTLKLIISRTLPLTIGLFAIMFVQLVDSIFIGKLGVNQLTVHGLTLPFQAGFIGVQVGIGVAATSIISQAVGARNTQKSATIATISVGLGSLVIASICVLLVIFTQPLFDAFIDQDISASQYTLLFNLFKLYWPYWLCSTLSVAVLYLVTCIYRANGDTKTTGSMFLLASIINLILDPILMFSFDMGIKGAAIASSIGYCTSTLYMLYQARHKHWFAALHFNSQLLQDVISLIKVIIPTIANQLLPSVSVFISMLLIAKLGAEMIAFWSLLARIESFLLVFTLAMTMSIPPMIGCFMGEKRLHKVDGVLNKSAKFLLIFHFVVAVVIALTASMIVPEMTNETTIQSWLTTALWIIPFSYGPLGLCMVSASVFNALGTPKRALWISFIRLFIFYIPAICIGVTLHSVIDTIIAATIANILAGSVAWFKLKQYVHLECVMKQSCGKFHDETSSCGTLIKN